MIFLWGHKSLQKEKRETFRRLLRLRVFFLRKFGPRPNCEGPPSGAPTWTRDTSLYGGPEVLSEQASQRSKAFKHVSFFFFSGIISRCNTFGAWRYFDNSKFWFCLFCIYRHILSMVFFFKLCFSFSTSSPINLFAVFQGCHNAGSELCSPAGPCSLAGKTIPAAG